MFALCAAICCCCGNCWDCGTPPPIAPHPLLCGMAPLPPFTPLEGRPTPVRDDINPPPVVPVIPALLGRLLLGSTTPLEKPGQPIPCWVVCMPVGAPTPGYKRHVHKITNKKHKNSPFSTTDSVATFVAAVAAEANHQHSRASLAGKLPNHC